MDQGYGMNPASARRAVRVAARAAFGAAPEWVARLPGGANNLVFRVRAAGRDVLAKAYFTHPGDPRDRLGAEYGMLEFLWRHGVRCVPEPLFADRAGGVGLYAFVAGARPLPETIVWADVAQLADLLAAMWRLRTRAGAARLPAGSDSAFSIGGFLDNVGGRLRHALRGLEAPGSDPAARAWVQDVLRGGWRRVRAFVEDGARRAGLDPAAPLAPGRRTLNPADHGFHNALRAPDGRLTFLDFEYAGWDDPAQMLCNACLQPAVPIPEALQRPFVGRVVRAMGSDRALAARLKILYPVFGFKWCLIMLNEFLPVSRERRRFAGRRPDRRRAEQLEKAGRRWRLVEGYLERPAFFDGLAGAAG